MKQVYIIQIFLHIYNLMDQIIMDHTIINITLVLLNYFHICNHHILNNLIHTYNDHNNYNFKLDDRIINSMDIYMYIYLFHLLYRINIRYYNI